MPNGVDTHGVCLWFRTLYCRFGRGLHGNLISGPAYSDFKTELVDARLKLYQVECRASGHIPCLWLQGPVPESGQHRPKSEPINSAAVQLGEVVDHVMITVGWATAVTVWVGGRKECIQALCILGEREHHPEICWIFLCLEADSTGDFSGNLEHVSGACGGPQ